MYVRTYMQVHNVVYMYVHVRTYTCAVGAANIVRLAGQTRLLVN